MKNSGALSTAANPPRRARSAPPVEQRFRLLGPSARLDPRIHAVRRDIADISLADRVFAPHYAEPQRFACGGVPIMLREAPGADARAVSQLLPGEGFAVVDRSRDWAWGYGIHDNYVGYIPFDALDEPFEPTFRVISPAALLFAAADIKSAALAVLPIGACIAGVEEGNFVASPSGFVHRRHIAPITVDESDPATIAERLLGMPYLWGGRGGGGIDCSGLVQLALGLCGIVAPRDTDQQRDALGNEIAGDDDLRRGDIIFFPGHVGFMADGERLIHANAHWMAVTVEPLAAVVARLKPNHDKPVLARRRLP